MVLSKHCWQSSQLETVKNMKQKYIVEVKENGQWVPNGDGELTVIQAERIAREIRQDCRCPARVVPANQIDRDQIGASGMEDVCGING